MPDKLKILTTIVHFLHYGKHMKRLIKIGQIYKRGSPSGLNDLRGLDITNQLRISPTTTDQAFPWKFHATDGKSTAAQGTCVCFAFHRLLWCIDSILPLKVQIDYKVIK